ncbi:MAG: MMPL family transporter [Chloroflexi bacterium]|nr:MAG: MMPL family transporter [Chloroflexota bacterium]
MGNFLHTLGVYAYHHKWRVISAWIVVLIGLGIAAATFITPTNQSISIPGTQAQTAIDKLGNLFPDAGKGTGRVVIHTADKTIQDYSDTITTVTDSIKGVDGVSGAISPLDYAEAVSKDNKTAYIQVQLANDSGEVTEETRTAIADITDKASQQGLEIERGGDLVSKAPGEILGISEVFGLVIALVVLLMTLGSLVSAGMPVLTAIVAVGASMAGLFGLSQVVDINATTPALAVMLGLAVGIDYSLFIISKYRTLLLRGYSNKDAAGRAIGTAGNAVIFAAATVVIALSALSVVQIPFMTVMGLAGAATIAIAAVVAITLIPAMLGVAGAKIFTGKTRKAIIRAQKQGVKETALSENKVTFWQKWGKAITKRPVVSIVASLLVIGVMAIPVQKLTLGIPADQYAAAETTERKAYDLLTNGFGAGFNGPLTVIAENVPPVTDSEKQIVREQIMAALNQQIATKTAEQTAQFEQRSFTPLYQLNLVAESIKKGSQSIESVTPAMVTDDGKAGIIQIIPTSAPASKETADLIGAIRDDQTKFSGNSAISLDVTGAAALEGDINHKLADALPTYLAVVVGLSLILLIVAFRSILVPLKATFGFLLSVLAMFGAIVAVFQWGWFGIAEPAPIVSFIPIIGIGILFGLAMDYEFFLVSSMHESYQHTKKAKQSVVEGFGQGAKVVTAAAIIMVAVFAGFIGNHDTTIQAIGFGLAIGIFVDAFIVRMTFVPAVMTLLGDKAWWIPKWLDRLLPHVSIEGEEFKK